MKHAPDAASLLGWISKNPLDVQAYCRLAEVFQSNGAAGSAQIALRRAIEINPFHCESWERLGALEAARRDWAGAIGALEQACAIEPGSVRHWVALAKALILNQDVRKAASVTGRLLADFPQHSESHVIAGHMAKIHGKFGEAMEAYDRALQLNPRQTDALYNLADLVASGMTTPLALNIERLLQDPHLSLRESADVLFSLARIHEKTGSVDQAFLALRAANAAAESLLGTLGQTYQPQQQEIAVDRIRALFPAETWHRSLEPIDLDLRLIFIVGLPRSGTTLVEQILNRHSHVSSVGELPAMQVCLSTLLDRRIESGRSGSLEVDEENDRQLLEELREYYLDALFARGADKACAIDKLPANFSAVGLIRVIFPDAIIVHCTRHPIATCWSLYASHFGEHLGYYTSLEYLVHYHNRVYSRLVAHWAETCKQDLIEINHESLVTNPEPSVRELLQRCGLDWEDACMSDAPTGNPIYTASMQSARQPINADSLKRWRAFESHIGVLSNGLRDTQGTSL